MGADFPVVALGGGVFSVLAGVIFYLLRHISVLYTKLGEAQSANTAAANERVKALEEKVRDRDRQIEMFLHERAEADRYARERQAAIEAVSRGMPGEAGARRQIERLADERLREQRPPGGGPLGP